MQPYEFKIIPPKESEVELNKNIKIVPGSISPCCEHFFKTAR